MNVYSCKGLFLFIVIISCSALLSQPATEITKDNCKNNRTFLSECSFNISFQPPLMEKLECFLTFPTKTNYSVRFSSESFVLQRQVGQMCPQFNIGLKTQDGKPKQLFTTCGETVNPVLRTFIKFSWGYILYDNKGLIDNSTNIKMQLWLETGKPCDDSESKTFDIKDHQPLIIILSAVSCLVVMIVCGVIVYRYFFKENENETPNSPSPEANISLYVFEKGGNDKGRDLGDDRNGQGRFFGARYILW